MSSDAIPRSRKYVVLKLVEAQDTQDSLPAWVVVPNPDDHDGRWDALTPESAAGMAQIETYGQPGTFAVVPDRHYTVVVLK